MGVDTLFVSAGFINACILLAAFSSLKGKIKRAAKILGLFILFYFITLLNWVVFPLIGSANNILLPWIPVLFFIPALAFLFFKVIKKQDFRIHGKYWLLFIPGMVDTFYHLIQYILALIHNGSDYAFFMNRNEGYFIHDGLAILFTMVCLFLIIKEIGLSRIIEPPAKNFYLLFIIFLFYMFIRWTSFYIIDLVSPQHLNGNLFFISWTIEMTGLLIVGYKAFLDSRLFNIKEKAQDSGKEVDLKALSQQLIQLIESEKLYLNKDLKRHHLADIMNISDVNISYILNHVLNTTFYGLINKYRVEEVITYLYEGDHKFYTLESLAARAGFKSLTTFNKSFKDVTGVSPRDFIKMKGI